MAAVLTTKNTGRQMPARRQYWRQPEIFLFRPFAEALYYFEALHRSLADAENPLTGRQRQILTMMTQGKTSGEIAEELNLSRRHRARMMRSTGIRSVAELMAWSSTEMN
ncbi:LuxR C-terminal-related transcriptional regulator [Rhizobium sp.]|uniref:LuxR C-terminal-related transcriptional regulator n=1 Tax=Rhizobium sp. TaxID=391 RepID=UPI0028A92E60